MEDIETLPPDENPFLIRETAALLYAADMIYFREHRNADFQLDWCRSLLRPGEADPVHCGDCNNQPQTCLRCVWEEWRDKALIVLKGDGPDWMGERAVRAAVEAEREACAQVLIDSLGGLDAVAQALSEDDLEGIAIWGRCMIQAIRARGR